ncbi:hypothetical protein WG908_04285 [Sphingobium sp. AN641]|uniref:ImuA family protein n=1 Tax=Sphingobium sp. AN641 TaxID=3133443 RepID=UPI0030C02B02
MSDSASPLAALRRTIAALDRGKPRWDSDFFCTGHGGLDTALGGGLARGRVHELVCAEEEAGAGAGMALLLARLATRADDVAPLLWLRLDAASRQGGAPYGPGLAALGIDPGRLLLGTMTDEAMLLQAGLDAVRCPGLGAVMIECRGRHRLLDLTASRRLALAAEASGVTALLLLVGGVPGPSAAETRWQVAAAPSAPLAGDAPGHGAFDLTLLRRRAGPDGMRWRLEWRATEGVFGEWSGGQGGQQQHGREGAALSGAVVSIPAARPAADRAA